MILGLTGGMGCGKTTAARFFEEFGFGTIDSDAIVHDLQAHDREVIDAIAERFGTEVLDERGGIHRKHLGARVFKDEKELQWLENLLHPLVAATWRGKVARETDRPWVVQIPLLFEKKLEQSFNFTVCVGTSAENQRRRLLKKGFSDADIARRISRQMPLHEKTARADFFLLNDGSLQFLREQVEHLLRELNYINANLPN
ncbi:MAG TPA: dephospho-CoA kinase [Opitutales bacterium]|nr:dephospho-CoA kinase [Opitutales bacterium]